MLRIRVSTPLGSVKAAAVWSMTMVMSAAIFRWNAVSGFPAVETSFIKHLTNDKRYIHYTGLPAPIQGRGV
jgi:hypothetical protein